MDDTAERLEQLETVVAAILQFMSLAGGTVTYDGRQDLDSPVHLAAAHGGPA